jgi:hypothetical protein
MLTPNQQLQNAVGEIISPRKNHKSKRVRAQYPEQTSSQIFRQRVMLCHMVNVHLKLEFQGFSGPS